MRFKKNNSTVQIFLKIKWVLKCTFCYYKIPLRNQIIEKKNQIPNMFIQDRGLQLRLIGGPRTLWIKSAPGAAD